MKTLNKLILITLAVILGLPLNAFSGGGVNASYGQSRNTVRSTDYNNSTSTAEQGAINYNVGGDMLAAGYNALAEDINMDIGGALTLESLQDEYYAKGSSFGLSGGMSMGNKDAGGKEGKGVTGGSLGVNVGSDYTDVAWVENQTSIIGTKSVDIEADSVHLKGAMIANAEYTAGPEEEGGLKAVTEADLGANDDSSYGWSDKGNLTIRANEVTYEDIVDIDNSESSGFGFDLSASYGENQQKKDMLSGTAGVSVKHEGQEKEQSTKATIGQGRIIIGGSEATEEQLEGLNRDVNASQEITKDMITGALDASLSVDLRMFTEEGREDISTDFENLGQNLATAAAGVVDGSMNLGKAAYAAGDAILNGEGISGAKDKVGVMQTTREFELAAKSIRDNMEKAGKSEEEISKALNEQYVKTAKKYGVADEDYAGYLAAKELDMRAGAEKDNTGVVNIAKGSDGQMSNEEYATTSVHEMMHGKGKDEAYAESMGAFAGSVSGGALTIMDTGGIFNGDLNYNSGVFKEGNDFLNKYDPSETNNSIAAIAGISVGMGYVIGATVIGRGDVVDGHKQLQDTPLFEGINKALSYLDPETVMKKVGMDMLEGKVAAELDAQGLPGTELAGMFRPAADNVLNAMTQGEGVPQSWQDYYNAHAPAEVKGVVNATGEVGGIYLYAGGLGATAAGGAEVAGAGSRLLLSNAGAGWNAVGSQLVPTQFGHGPSTFILDPIKFRGPALSIGYIEETGIYRALTPNEMNGIMQGGPAKILKGNANEVHHLIADAVSDLKTGAAPGISMPKADHLQTPSHGSNPFSNFYRGNQRNLINQGNYQGALNMDTSSIGTTFPDGRYNRGIQQSQSYLNFLEKSGNINNVRKK
ncbi:hemagluttinin repeat-containing protein [Parelusimicrobium proximum]|uniref:hemagglutinin repeat-containing protein n=1 Tax=Parelusimicrobium proximum TaxID=3228953 RepID=UPI003D177389